MTNNNFSKNVDSFMSIIKLVLFIIVVSFVLSLIASILSFFNKPSVDGQKKLKDDYEEYVETGVIDPKPWDPTIPEKMINGQVIDDIYSDLSVFEYEDIVVFVKNATGSSSDKYSHNIVFRKTDKGLVMDGMFLHYDFMGYTVPSVSNFLSRSTSDLYPTYNNYNFMSNFVWSSSLYSQSCFSFNNNVSSAIMFNRTFVGSLFGGIRNIISSISSLIDYSNCYEVVNKYCIKDIFTEFTSFGENQHIMYSSLDEFSDFWTDIYNSIKTLNKNCLVNYTGCHVGLYTGDPSSENCKYFSASSYFKVKYQKIGHKAYSVDTKNYTEGHEFNCENKATAIPEITFELIQDTVNSTSDYTKLYQYLAKNNCKLNNNLEIYETSLNSVNIYDIGFNNFSKYMDFGSYSAHVESVITQSEKEIVNDIISFEDISFEVDKNLSKIYLYYTINISSESISDKQIVPDNPTEPDNPEETDQTETIEQDVIKYYVNGELFQVAEYEVGTSVSLLTKHDIFEAKVPDKKENNYIFYGWFTEAPNGDLKQLSGIDELQTIESGIINLYGRFFRVRANGEAGYSDAKIQINVTLGEGVTEADAVGTAVQLEYYDEELGYTRINTFRLTSAGLTIAGLKYANMIIRIKTTIKVSIDGNQEFSTNILTSYKSISVINITLEENEYSGIVEVGTV